MSQKMFRHLNEKYVKTSNIVLGKNKSTKLLNLTSGNIKYTCSDNYRTDIYIYLLDTNKEEIYRFIPVGGYDRTDVCVPTDRGLMDKGQEAGRTGPDTR